MDKMGDVPSCQSGEFPPGNTLFRENGLEGAVFF